jgi:cyclopropane fatty-acyl-phospholipid synthase-like methyltransferase
MGKFSRSLRRILFNTSYLFRPAWDSGIPAPELVEFISGHPAGNALDIGCGTGTNLLYLAQHDWKISGVDFAWLAIAKAKKKVRGYPKTLLAANVTKLANLVLPGPYDLALDMGCFHSLPIKDRQSYIKGVEKWVKPSGVLMLYAFQPSKASSIPGISREDMQEYFAETFDLSNYEQGMGRPSAWYYFSKK